MVTGASGFLGGRLCHALVKQGACHVKAFVRPSSSLDELPSSGVELVYGDLNDSDSLLRAFHGCSAIFHCGAFVTPWAPDPSKFFTVNVDGLKNVANAVWKTSTVKKLIYVSSFFALGPSDGKLADERQMHPGVSFCTEYERSKVFADTIALQEAKKGLPIVLTYPGVLYGPGKVTAGNSLAALIIERCSGRLPGKLGTGKDQFSFCHVDDVAQGCIAAMEKGRQGERYLLTGQNASFNEIFGLVDSLRGQKPSQFQIPIWSLQMAGWISVFWAKLTGYSPIISYPMVRVFKKQWSYSHEKAKQELGYESRPLKQGVTEFLSWMESSGLIKKR